MRVLQLHCIPVVSWEAAVAPIVGHHGRTLTEVTLSGIPNRCRPNRTKLRVVFEVSIGGVSNPRIFNLVHVFFEVGDAAAVAAACPVPSRLTISGIIGFAAGAAVGAQALPSLIRLSWIATADNLSPNSLTPRQPHARRSRVWPPHPLQRDAPAGQHRCAFPEGRSRAACGAGVYFRGGVRRHRPSASTHPTASSG